MKSLAYLQIVSLLLFTFSCKAQQKPVTGNINKEEFPGEMVEFVPYKMNPVFKGTGTNTWDKQIRERGILYLKTAFIKCGIQGTMEMIPLPNI